MCPQKNPRNDGVGLKLRNKEPLFGVLRYGGKGREYLKINQMVMYPCYKVQALSCHGPTHHKFKKRSI